MRILYRACLCVLFCLACTSAASALTLQEIDTRTAELRARLAQAGVDPYVLENQDEKIGQLALGGVRLVDPSAACIRTVKDDLEDAALLLPGLGRKRTRLVEFLEQDLDDALQFALLGGRQMIEVGAHFYEP